MRYEEDKIFGAYVESLIVESKKGKKLPPWLKEKKSDKGEEGEKEEKEEKKSDKKKKNLPPWLKGKKGKKVIKEEVEDGGMSREDKVTAIIELINDADDVTLDGIYDMISGSGEENVFPEGGSEETEEIPAEIASPVASVKNPPQDTSRYMR